MKLVARLRFRLGYPALAGWLLAGALAPHVSAEQTNAATTNAAPKPSPFLAPPPFGANQPEAPPLVINPKPDTIVRAARSEAGPAGTNTAPSSEARPAGPQQVQVPVPSPSHFANPAGDPDHLADHLLVVYNANDPQSKALALYYAKRRQIPAERILELSCLTSEEITRDEFERTIHQPIVDNLLAHHWLERRNEMAQINGQSVPIRAATHNNIWAIVLMRGVPLKIAASASTQPSLEAQPELQTTAASVDSELALLPIAGLPLGGFLPNAFFDTANAGEVRAGPELATHLVLVTRLDGPTASNVRRMIDDCLSAEKNRLAGAAVIDSRGFTDPANGYTEGDVWLRKSRDLLAADGWPVVFDDHPATLPANSPLNQVALYLGWYTPTADGPWVTPPDRLVRGAIAYHLHSFSAQTVRSTTQNWVGPLIDHGVDATMGNVYEPYLELTPHLDIFTRRLLDGDSFAEAAWASELGLSWMTTMVGDPLYRPFQRPMEEAIAAPESAAHREWLLLQQIDRQLDFHPPTDAAALETAFHVPGAGPILAEHLGDLLQKLSDPAAPADAEKAYTAALQQSTEPIDCIRIGLKLSQLQVLRNEYVSSQAELQSLRESYPIDAVRFGVPGARPMGGK